MITGPNAEEKRIITYTLTSAYQNRATPIRVLLPKNMDKTKRYSVLYILPVRPAQRDFWWDSGILEALKNNIADKYNVICVAPSLEAEPWFGNHASNPKIRQEGFMINMVIPFIDYHFSTNKSPEGRFLVGYSNSGFGALHLLLRHPDIFGKAASWDGYVTVPNLKAKKILGSIERAQHYQIPLLLRAQAPFFQNRKTRIILMGYSQRKDDVERAHQMMMKLNIPHIYSVTPKKYSSWDSGWFPQAMEYLLHRN